LPAHPATAIAAAVGLSILVGAMVYLFLMRKMTGEMALAAVLTTVALGVLLRGVTVLVWSAQQQYPAQPLGIVNTSIALPGGARISLCGAAGVSTVIVYMSLLAFLRFGRWGVRMRAAGARRSAAGGARGASNRRLRAQACALHSTGPSAALLAVPARSGETGDHRPPAAPAALVGGLDGRGRVARLLIVASAEVLLMKPRPAAVRGRPFLVLIAMLVVTWGCSVPRRARPCLGGPAPAPTTTHTSGPGAAQRRGWSACRWLSIVALLALIIASPFLIDLASQTFLASSARSPCAADGLRGRVSLGHAGLFGRGGLHVGILFKGWRAVLGHAAGRCAGGVLLGVLFGLPSLRLRGLYLAISTLAAFSRRLSGRRVRAKRGFSTGIVVDPPTIVSKGHPSPRAWYFILLAAAAATSSCAPTCCAPLGRAWAAIRAGGRWRRRSASALPATSCSPSSSARR
jgi:branched-chain amino acid transport system permease protein